MQPLNSIARVRAVHGIFFNLPVQPSWGYTVPARAPVYPRFFYGETDVNFLKLFKFSFPLHKETLESWIKLMDDITKGAVLGMLSLPWLDSQPTYGRILGMLCLPLVAYIAQLVANLLRTKGHALLSSDTKESS